MCICSCMHVHVCVCVLVCVHLCVYVYASVHVHVCGGICLSIYICGYVCLFHYRLIFLPLLVSKGQDYPINWFYFLQEKFWIGLSQFQYQLSYSLQPLQSSLRDLSGSQNVYISLVEDPGVTEHEIRKQGKWSFLKLPLESGKMILQVNMRWQSVACVESAASAA